MDPSLEWVGGDPNPSLQARTLREFRKTQYLLGALSRPGLILPACTPDPVMQRDPTQEPTVTGGPVVPVQWAHPRPRIPGAVWGFVPTWTKTLQKQDAMSRESSRESVGLSPILQGSPTPCLSFSITLWEWESLNEKKHLETRALGQHLAWS